jgi:hypothetical protein
MRWQLLLLVALAALVSGCGASSRAVLDEGVSFGPHGKLHRIGPSEALADARAAHAKWLEMLQAAAQGNSKRRFQSPSGGLLAQRLDRAASAFGFQVESVTLRRPQQLAPDIVIESDDYLALVRSLPQILDRIDPPPRSNNRVYEGIFLEAVDEQHAPFVLVFDSLRGQVAGGQWARADALFPYEHG